MVIDFDGKDIMLGIDDAAEFHVLDATFQKMVPNYHSGDDVRVSVPLVRDFMIDNPIEGSERLQRERTRLINILNSFDSKIKILFTTIAPPDVLLNYSDDN